MFKFLAKFRAPQKRILIIKTDVIGDYILFRNFIEIAKTSVKYQDCQIDLLCNVLLKDVAKQYDGAFINNFLFTTEETLYNYHRPLHTFRLGWQLFRNNYSVVLQPTYNRTLITDGLAGLSAAKYVAGFESNTERILAKYKTKTDRFYTTLLSLPPSAYFEFDRVKYFFETTLNQTIHLNGPVIKVEIAHKHGIFIFPGANVFKRSWEAERFLALIKLILLNTQQPIHIAGGPAELQIGDYLTENLPPESIINLIGKTSLVQLIELVGNAALVIANETGAVHIAAATQTRSVCILGGGHFGRFAPYPEHIENKPNCIYHKMDCYYCNWNCIYKTKENEPFPCISSVSLDSVWKTVLPLLLQ